MGKLKGEVPRSMPVCRCGWRVLCVLCVLYCVLSAYGYIGLWLTPYRMFPRWIHRIRRNSFSSFGSLLRLAYIGERNARQYSRLCIQSLHIDIYLCTVSIQSLVYVEYMQCRLEVMNCLDLLLTGTFLCCTHIHIHNVHAIYPQHPSTLKTCRSTLRSGSFKVEFSAVPADGDS